MSGIKNLANMVANEPSSRSMLKGLNLSNQELADLVPQGMSGKKSGSKTGKAMSGKKY